MLEAGKRGWVHGFDQFWLWTICDGKMAGPQHLHNCCFLWDVPNLQWSQPTKSRKKWVVNQWYCHGQPRITDEATVAQQINIGTDRKVSEHTPCFRLLCMGLHCRRLFRVPITDLCTPPKVTRMGLRNGSQSNGRRLLGVKNRIFFHIMWTTRSVSISHLGMPWEEAETAGSMWCSGQCSAGRL